MIWQFLVRWRIRFLYASSVLTLVALALMCWSVVDPRPLQVIAAMTLGQALGTAAFAMFGAVIILDLWKAKIPHEGKPAAPAEEPAEAPEARAQAPEARAEEKKG